jgi:hypothetical protein
VEYLRVQKSKQPAAEISSIGEEIPQHHRSPPVPRKPMAILLPSRIPNVIVHYVMNGRAGRIVAPPNDNITRSKLEKNLLPVNQDDFGKENNSGYIGQAYGERQYWTPNIASLAVLRTISPD